MQLLKQVTIKSKENMFFVLNLKLSFEMMECDDWSGFRLKAFSFSFFSLVISVFFALAWQTVFPFDNGCWTDEENKEKSKIWREGKNRERMRKTRRKMN